MYVCITRNMGMIADKKIFKDEDKIHMAALAREGMLCCGALIIIWVTNYTLFPCFLVLQR